MFARSSTARPESEAARLFREGRAALVAERFAEACAKLSRSQELEPRLGTELNVAFCNERIGKVASAWLGFQRAAATADLTGDGERRRFAQRMLEALERRVPRLRVRRPPESTAALELQVDGKPFALDTAVPGEPIDPGTHTLRASSAGREYWQTTISLQESQRLELTVAEPPRPQIGPLAAAERPDLISKDAPNERSRAAAHRPALRGEGARFVFEADVFVGFVIVDTNRAKLDQSPSSVRTSMIADGMLTRQSCATAPCEVDSIGSNSGAVVGVAGYAGYAVSPGTSIGMRALGGARAAGGTLFALGPSASFEYRERFTLGPALLFGAASHTEQGFGRLETTDGFTTIDARVRATLGVAMGFGAFLGMRMRTGQAGSLALQMTPLFLYGPNGLALTLPLGVAYRWH